MLCEAVPLLPGLAREAVGGRGWGKEEEGERGGEKKNKREGEEGR